MLLPKQDSQDRYEVLQELGKGGMGVVELVKDHLLEREVARKTILVAKATPRKEDFERNQLLLWRLLQEAYFTAVLEHPNIVPLYEMQQKNATEWQFTMRKVEGQTLRALFSKKRKGTLALTTPQLLQIFLKVCEGVRYSHSKKIIHRDLKPENIMVGSYGEVYVLDWGIAKQLGATAPSLESPLEEPLPFFQTTTDSQRTLGGLGTIGYMSPEQQENASQVTVRSDLYALGKILRECFILRSPWEEFQDLIQQDSVRLKQHSKKKQSYSSADQSLPKEIQAIVTKATAPESSQRYSSVFDLSEDIQRYLKNLPVSAKEYTFWEIFFKFCQRYRHFLGILLGTFLFLSGFWLYQRKLEAMKLIQQREENHQLLEQAFHFAQHQIRLAKHNALPERESRSLQIQHFLQALSFFNQALAFTTPFSEISAVQIEREKLQLGSVLLSLCYEEEDYSMATFVVEDLKTLSNTILSELEKERFRDEIQNRKKMLLTQHCKTLDEWETYFKLLTQSPKPEEIQEFIYEINAMEEKEVFQKLLNLFKEGTDSLLKPTSERRNELNPFYCAVVTLLGRSRHQGAGKLLKDALSLFYKGTTQYRLYSKVDRGQIDYLCELFIALCRLQEDSFYECFETFRRSPLVALFRLKVHFIYEKTMHQLIERFSLKIRANPQDMSLYCLRAGTYFDQNSFQKAIDDYSVVLRSDLTVFKKNELFLIYTSCGRAKRMLNDFEGAAHDFNQALQLDPKNPEFAEIYAYQAHIKWSRGDFNGAIEDCYAGLQLNPNDIEICTTLGAFLMQQEKWNEAITFFSRVLQTYPLLPNVYLLRGQSKRLKADYEGAIADFSEALSLHPQYIDAYLLRGLSRFQKEDYEAAITDYTEVLSINPQLIEAYIGRGRAKSQKGDDNGAIADYEKGLSLKPTPTLLEECLAELNPHMAKKYQAKDYSGAIQILKKIMQHLPPDHPGQKQYQQKMQQLESLLRR